MLKPFQANLLNAVVMLLMGGWAFLEKGTAAPTALIPVFAGAILLSQTTKIRDGDKNAAHIAVILTLLMVLGLFKPFFGQLAKGDTAGVFRTSVMLLTGIVAMVIFVQSFIAARKARLGNLN